MDIDGHNKIDSYAQRTKRALDQGKFFQATDLWYQTEIVVLQYNMGVDFYNVLFDTGYRNSESQAKLLLQSPRQLIFELLVKNKRFSADESDDEDNDDKLTRLMRGVVKDALGIPDKVNWGSQSSAVFETLAGDFMKPVVHMVEEVLNNSSVKVVVYSGQLDLICSTPGTVEWVNKMNWYGSKEYAEVRRNGIGVNNILEGYSRQYGNFSMYWVSFSAFL